jgi:hypothetical protein
MQNEPVLPDHNKCSPLACLRNGRALADKEGALVSPLAVVGYGRFSWHHIQTAAACEGRHGQPVLQLIVSQLGGCEQGLHIVLHVWAAACSRCGCWSIRSRSAVRSHQLRKCLQQKGSQLQDL